MSDTSPKGALVEQLVAYTAGRRNLGCRNMAECFPESAERRIVEWQSSFEKA